MSDIPNSFEGIAKTKRGRPASKVPVGESQKDKAKVGSTQRKPVGLRRRASAPTREGYHRRWVNDIEDRVGMFEDGGYTPVKGEDGNHRVRRTGSGKQAVLMEIPEDLYQEDQQAKYAQWNKDNQERLQPREGTGYYQPKTKI